MHYIDMDTWPRRDHFQLFRTWDFPHFNLCANVDITAFRPAVKRRGVSFTVAVLYVITRVANAIPEFRYRIRGDAVVEHEVVHPGTTILAADDLFIFCYLDYTEDFAAFATQATAQITKIREQSILTPNAEKDDLSYTTAMPWVSFTSVMHPLKLSPVDSIPRIAWGKFFTEGARLKMPVSVQAHHGLVDGVHAGRYFERLQTYLDDPDAVLGGP
ncbi:MAG: chloramphenicol acetyltransferase [Anaerolineae bacterium]|nr:chloramphenicol acetyltransferase [Anaerolineae bacterium]